MRAGKATPASVAGRAAAVAAFAVAALVGFAPGTADAVPSMARQMNVSCSACHTVFPELTSFGRQFKLRGYSLSVPKDRSDEIFGNVPIAALLQVSRTSTRNTTTDGATPEDFPRDRDVIVQGAGLYYGGKLFDNAGAFIQYFYDGIDKKWKTEMVDMRYANTAEVGAKELIYGFTLNNAPTAADVFNSTPVWEFPHTETAAVMPNASTMLDMTLGSKVAGPGVYGMWNNLLYGEFALYRTNKTGIFRPLGWGNERDPLVKGYAPYWRLALQREWDEQMVSVGTFGMRVRTNLDPDDANSPTDRFRDLGFDAQYKYTTDNHQFSTHATYIREKQDLNASFDAGEASNASNRLRTFKIDAHYFYQRRFGGGIQFFQTRGSADDMRYNMTDPDTGLSVPVMGSINGSPNNRGWTYMLNFLPAQNVKLELRYTQWKQFNGAGTNYDGRGRNASDNNAVYLLGWFLF